ncbi:MAG: hypothetical protein MJ033_00910 [Victivallaceae bacterium]|nr:hypothetical protein [Victivallaceae bacterium]
MLKKLSAIFLVALIAFGASAFSWTTLGPRRKPVTLIITANYKSPRLLADLIQAESRQPYLLLPAPESGDSRIIFCPYKKNGAMLISEDRINEFVRWLAPRRIIVLGNETFVPRRYTDLLDRTIPVIRIESKSWGRAAEELNYLLNLSNLGKDYRRLQQEMLEAGGIYRPISRPAAPAAPIEPMKEDAQAQAETPAEEVPVASAPAEELPAAPAAEAPADK